jgi:hypothetical protein
MASQYITQADPMMSQTLIDPEAQALQRQKQYAAALMQQNQQPQGQMIGGRFVAPSFTQQLSSAINPLLGAYMLNQADTKQAQLAEALREQGDKDLMAYGQAVTPKPAVEGGIYGPDNKLTTQTTADMYGANMELNPQYKEVAPQAAVEPDFAKGMRILRSSKDPETRQLAKILMADQMKTLILPEGATAIRGSLFGSGGQTVTGAPKEPTEYKEYVKAKEGGFQGSFFDYQTALKKAGATNVNVPISTEKSYGGGLAMKAVDQDAALKSIADSAEETVAKVARNKKILESGKLFTGKGADIQLELAQYADALGLGGKGTLEKATNTQSAISGLAEVTLDSIKTSGLGSGQGFTDKDREFLQDAKSGRITWNKDNIMRVYDLQEKAAIQGVKRYNQRFKQMPRSATEPLGWTEVPVPNAYGQSSVRNEADKILEGK